MFFFNYEKFLNNFFQNNRKKNRKILKKKCIKNRGGKTVIKPKKKHHVPDWLRLSTFASWIPRLLIFKYSTLIQFMHTTLAKYKILKHSKKHAFHICSMFYAKHYMHLYICTNISSLMFPFLFWHVHCVLNWYKYIE